ncbi:methyl-accepting chemotaxis protein [Massilia rhizosphaerae]|uniref:methyl-accepting chemotaxis protein n=1 Tax=Massilia rhizosphaerae TaxID=2784389 RepID=UPI0018DDA372|nr:methyl-accepting chemotaxis protein [Massilia rhizosphaerae]
MLSKFTVKARLIAVIAFLGFELICGATIGLLSLAHANGAMHDMYADRLVTLGQLDQIVRKLNLNQLALAEALTSDAGRLSKLIEELDSNHAEITRQWQAFTATGLTGEGHDLAERFIQANDKYTAEATQPAVAALRAGDMERAKSLVHGAMIELFVPVRASINALLQLQLDEAAKAEKKSQATYETVRLVCLSGMAFGLVLAAIIGATLVRGIVRPLEKAVRVAGAVADGDLTQDISTEAHDETGRLMRALEHMNAGLADIVGRVRAGTGAIRTSSAEIAAGNLDLSARTEQQAAALEQTASSMEELTSTVKQNADNARQANTLALSAAEVAGKGGAVVSEVVSTMGAINASAARIADIIGVIDGIAFQTNILALNAAVEAARAGEQGRGFAVVASEVRTLAQRSAAAAKEIKALIDDSVEKVQHGSQLVDKAGATMGDIVRSVNQVTAIMGEILVAGEEQATGIEQVSRAIGQMDEATQQNAALVEQASAAAQAMREEADRLADAVGVFRLRLQDAGARPAAAASGAMRIGGPVHAGT